MNEINPATGRRPLLKNAPPQLPEGPPDYRAVGRHAVFPETTHDEIARLNFLAQMNRHLATRIMPFVKTAWEKRVEPALQEPAKDRHDVRRALSEDKLFQTWSALRRMTMEQRQQAGRWTALRQAEALAEKAAALTDGDPRLALDPAVKIPRYVGAVDHHTMPGSYHTERFPGDVSAAANYDHAIFATTGGLLGRLTDGAARGIMRWLEREMPDFTPRRILEIGTTVGHSLLPIAAAFPQAEIIAVDLGAPVLRYGLARAKSLGIENVSFVQADATDLSRYEDGSFDWVQTTMFLHELSRSSMRAIFAECHRLLKPGGIMVHVEQPQYTPEMPLFEQAMRDWDSFNNNEPFWSTMHGIDLDALMTEVGFEAPKLIHGHVTAVVDKDIFPDAADDETEDYGRKAAWRLVGCTAVSIEDALADASAKPAGKRPYFLNPDIERVMAITMAVAQELAVARDRLDTLERLLDSKGVVGRDEIEGFEPTPQDSAERGLWIQEYLARILRIVQQEGEAITHAARGDVASEDVAAELQRED